MAKSIPIDVAKMTQIKSETIFTLPFGLATLMYIEVAMREGIIRKGIVKPPGIGDE